MISSDTLDQEPKLIRTNSGRVILFDPATQIVTTEKKDRLDAENITFCGRAPNVGDRAHIYAEQNSSLLVATLKLDKLGWQASWQRFCGKCNEIYTVNLPSV